MFQESTVLVDERNLPVTQVFSNAWAHRMVEVVAMLAGYANYEGVFGCWNALCKPRVSFGT